MTKKDFITWEDYKLFGTELLKYLIHRAKPSTIVIYRGYCPAAPQVVEKPDLLGSGVLLEVGVDKYIVGSGHLNLGITLAADSPIHIRTGEYIGLGQLSISDRRDVVAERCVKDDFLDYVFIKLDERAKNLLKAWFSPIYCKETECYQAINYVSFKEASYSGLMFMLAGFPEQGGREENGLNAIHIRPKPRSLLLDSVQDKGDYVAFDINDITPVLPGPKDFNDLSGMSGAPIFIFKKKLDKHPGEDFYRLTVDPVCVGIHVESHDPTYEGSREGKFIKMSVVLDHVKGSL